MSLTALIIPEIHSFNGYLEAIGEFIIGENYVTSFEIKGFDLDGSEFSAANLIKSAYPNSNPERGEFVEISVDGMVEYVNKNLRLPDPPYSDKGFREEIQKGVITSYWEHLKQCIDFEKARIVFYQPSRDVDDELWDFIFWGFTYLIWDEKRSRCVIIHGGACD